MISNEYHNICFCESKSSLTFKWLFFILIFTTYQVANINTKKSHKTSEKTQISRGEGVEPLKKKTHSYT